jgi:hypothetical protein
VAVPETAEAEKEGSLAAETETAVEMAAEMEAVEKTDALEKEGNTAVEAGTVEEVEGHEAETEAGTVEEVEEEENVEEASLGDREDDCDDGSKVVPPEDAVSPVLVNVAVVASQGSQDVYPSEAAAFKIFKNFEKIDFDLIVGNNEQEQFANIYRMAQMSELDREAELAKCHDALKACQDMQKLQEQQRQVDHM